MSSRSPEATRDRQTLATAAARQALAAFAPAKTAYVEYRSRGSLLIIGDAHRALKIADTLKRGLRTVVVTHSSETGREPRGVTVVRGEGGYTGQELHILYSVITFTELSRFNYIGNLHPDFVLISPKYGIIIAEIKVYSEKYLNIPD